MVRQWVGEMQESSFIIQFQEVDVAPFDPTRPSTVGYWLDKLRSMGADIDQLSNHRYCVRCQREAQLQRIGWTIHSTMLAQLADVVEVTGLAQNIAAYSAPPHKRHGK